MPRFRYDDDDVVVIVGSGAGGGTLANELCQKGVRVVVLEAGRPSRPTSSQRRVALVQAARLARQPHDVGLVSRRQGLPQPARVDRARPSAARPCTGPGAALASWSTSSRRRATATASRAPTRSTGRSASPTSSPTTTAPRTSSGSRRATASRPCRRTTTTRCSPTASARRLQRFHSGRYAVNPVPRDGRPASIQDGFKFQGDKNQSKWSTLYVELPKAAKTGRLDLRPESHVIRIEHDDRASSRA